MLVDISYLKEYIYMKWVCKHTNNISLEQFNREYSRYRYLYFYLREGWARWNILMTYTHDGEINHNQASTHNRGKSQGRINIR